MNIKKLAEITGVSAGTVSKAFSGSKEISEITREKIFAAAKENGRQVPPAGVSNVFFGTRKFNSSSFFWRYLPWWSLSQR